MNRLISVIIPCYNVAGFVNRCLNSVIANSYKELDIICVDDGSTDNTLELLREFAKLDSRIRVIAKDNGGVSSARNVGLKNTWGGYVSFVDSDDWVHPRYFEILMTCVQKEEALIVQSGIYRTNGEDIDTEKITEQYFIKTIYQLLTTNHDARLFVCGKLIKKELLEQLEFDESLYLGEDNLFIAQLCSKCIEEKCAIVPGRFYYYFNTREGSLSKSGNVENVMVSGERWYKEGLVQSQPFVKKYFLQEGMKKYLSVRYWTMFRWDAKKYKLLCNKMLRKMYREMKDSKSLSAKEMAVWGVFVYLPTAYRAYRIITDHGMLGWEREQRRLKKVKVD